LSLQQQLMEYIIQDIIEMLTVQQEMEYDEAMNKFYIQKYLKSSRMKKPVYIRKVQHMYMTFLKMK
jgi:hypothetical protein